MKRVTRLTLAALVAAASLPASAADGSMSFWDQLWYAMTGQSPVTVQAEGDNGGCIPRECNIKFSK